jgi:hypothetical protein
LGPWNEFHGYWQRSLRDRSFGFSTAEFLAHPLQIRFGLLPGNTFAAVQFVKALAYF